MITLIVGMLFLHWGILVDGRHISGDFGDARLNNIILEHNYRFAFSGWPTTYWTAPWLIHPFENSLALSKNFAAAAPIYILLRLFGSSPQDSFPPSSWLAA